MANNYLSVVYDQKSHPYGQYPAKLCAYLFQAFGMRKGMKMLEPGCGRGEFLSNFQELGLEVVGVDISEEAQNFGIEIVDVRIKRADLPPANSDAIYKRMQTEREREAKEFRAKGAEMAAEITANADKEVTVILANAEKSSQILKGEGDGERNKIFANAFGRDPQFFAFYRAMQAYEKALIGGETSLVLSPDSEFFKFFGKSIKPNIKR